MGKAESWMLSQCTFAGCRAPGRNADEARRGKPREGSAGPTFAGVNSDARSAPRQATCTACGLCLLIHFRALFLDEIGEADECHPYRRTRLAGPGLDGPCGMSDRTCAAGRGQH